MDGWFAGSCGDDWTAGQSLYAAAVAENLAIITALAACTLAPTVYTLATVNVAHTGSIPTAGPSSTAMRGSNNERSQADNQLVRYLLQHQNGATWIVAVASAN